MANKAFEIQNSTLRIGGVDLQAGSNSIVIPGVTQATNYFVEEVDEQDGSNPDTFGDDPGAVTIIDNAEYLYRSSIETASGSYSAAGYSVDELDDGEIDGINIEVDGVFSDSDKVLALDDNMWATTVADPYTNFDANDWTQIPYIPKMRAGEVKNSGVPYLELTNNPYIIQPVVLGTPVTVSTPGDGSGAEVEVVIGAGPVITSVTVTTPGTNYIVGQRYIIWAYLVGGDVDSRDSIDFEVATVGDGGELLTIADATFAGAATNNTGTYSGISMQLKASPGDAIDDGLTLVRSYRYALFNIEAETEYDSDNYTSPLGTEWNSEGWGDLSALSTRTYTTFREALDGNVGNNIIGAELIMHDTINDKYYKFSFSNWGGNNGGSYAYTRTLVEDPNYFRKIDYATGNNAINVFVTDDGEGPGIAITRANNGGIYNPYTEDGWDEDVSPEGTLWNIDGWGDLSDITERTYDNLYAAFGNDGLGSKIVGAECVMSVPSIGKYYAIKFLSWTQNNAGGGFSYTRREIDLDQLNEGIKFADGTKQTTAYVPAVPTNVKFTAVGSRRIEEVYGYKQVSVTAIGTVNLTATASRNYDDSSRIWVNSTTTTIDEIINNTEAAGITDNSTMQFSLDNTNWYTWSSGTWSDGNERGYGVTLGNATLTYSLGDTVYFRYVGGGAPVVWWDKDDLPGGNNDFRGAIIDYHAYIPGDGTIIGTIHIVDDDNDEPITHTEVSSGSSSLENADLWYVTSEGEIRYRQLDGASATLKIQWTAKVFYGSEYYND